jgi:hypothetical protein
VARNYPVMAEEVLSSRPEVVAMLWAIHDINDNIGRVVRFIEEGDDGEEEEEEAD